MQAQTWPVSAPPGRTLPRVGLAYTPFRRPTVPLALRGQLEPRPGLANAAQNDLAVGPDAENSEQPRRPDPLLDIAAAAAAGDGRAARSLILKMRASTDRIVRNVLGNAHPDLEDVTQEASIALIVSLKSFRGESSVAHYANSVTLRVALAARRRIQVSQRWFVTVAQVDEPPAVDLDTPLSVAMDKRSREVVLRVLRELPPTAAEVLTLHAICGYTTAEVARMNQVTEGTVRSQLRMGKKEFRRLLRRELRTGRLA
ncbi:MAG TPA: sigma-70 family RNA polymerase sigma factor [Polyangiaceae bacterium]|nr:sigma-70 family RNA polymerase sigma factor [Polyangiaceae bacterium]